MKKLKHDGMEREYEVKDIQLINKSHKPVEVKRFLRPACELHPQNILKLLIMYGLMGQEGTNSRKSRLIGEGHFSDREINNMITIYEKWRTGELFKEDIELIFKQPV